jgi:hypothetical protein
VTTPDPTDRPDPSDAAALPIARRIVRAAERAGLSHFPLLWRPHGPVERLPMVDWYEPRQLLDTALKTLFAMIVGQRSDQRIVQALASRKPDYYDYTFHYRDGRHGPYIDRARSRDEIWIDYLCDTGDGWNSTYAVAYAVAQPVLDVREPNEPRPAGRDSPAVTRLPRADLLVFGGDEVYPTPSREEYHRRLIVPYETAFGDSRPAESPHVFAIPGNHDWYDGLTAFARLFCSQVGGRHFAGWRTRQRRSYFALKLPGRWWLIASDGQLQSDIDTPQIEYFRQIADRHMTSGDRVIVCLASPVWVAAHKYRQYGGLLDETDLLYLRDEIFAQRGVTMNVFLAGDNHHYRRHEEVHPPDGQAPIQKITSGGGGAFLHPTHDEDVSILEEERITLDEVPRRFALRASYPGVQRSRRLAFGNLLFPIRNPRFGVVPAFVYLMTVWMVSAAIVEPRPASVTDAVELTARAFSRNPALTLWVLFLMVTLVTFSDTHSRLYRWLGGVAHAAAHWACMFAIGWGSLELALWLSPGWRSVRFTTVALLVAAGGWIVGSVLMGLYLLISLNVFGRHSEEAFSALRIQDFKNFLRMHIAPDGTLTIYPIRIERVPRRWRRREAGEGPTPSRVVPDDPLEPALIEDPVVIRTRR